MRIVLHLAKCKATSDIARCLMLDTLAKGRKSKIMEAERNFYFREEPPNLMALTLSQWPEFDSQRLMTSTTYHL